MAMSDHWWRNAIIYGVDIGSFVDSDGDGVGDIPGLTGRLDYLEELGVTCLWLLPFFPTPNRDNGYDVSDYYGVDPRMGDLGDFVELVREAESRGIHIMLDLVVDHTSDQHPWFRSAREGEDSPYHDYYVWTHSPDDTPQYRSIFPGVEEEVWSWDEAAEEYYFHRFYAFQPTLNHFNPAVRDEVRKIMGFWLQLGVSAFRIDAASHMIEPHGGKFPATHPHEVLQEYRRFAQLRKGNVVMMGESDVHASELGDFFGGGGELNLLMNFILNNYTWLALATGSAEPLIRGLGLLPPRRGDGQWVNFLRNLDEVDLERLTAAERDSVYRVFAPKKEMRIYDRGIRRRLAPMLGGERKRLELAFSLLLSLPGAPMLVYGDEIGMGEDLSLPERQSVRTAMQWSVDDNAGFSAAHRDKVEPVVLRKGPFSYQRVNVVDQQRDPGSLLRWVQHAIRVRRSCPEFGWGSFQVMESGAESVLAHRCEWEGSTLIAVHNLSERAARVELDLGVEVERAVVLLGGGGDDVVEAPTCQLRLDGYGYRWLRVGGLRLRQPHGPLGSGGGGASKEQR
jgi:maltose alpha-D-glucosyltransferase/alpha-amylase